MKRTADVFELGSGSYIFIPVDAQDVVEIRANLQAREEISHPSQLKQKFCSIFSPVLVMGLKRLRLTDGSRWSQTEVSGGTKNASALMSQQCLVYQSSQIPSYRSTRPSMSLKNNGREAQLSVGELIHRSRVAACQANSD